MLVFLILSIVKYTVGANPVMSIDNSITYDVNSSLRWTEKVYKNDMFAYFEKLYSSHITDTDIISDFFQLEFEIYPPSLTRPFELPYEYMALLRVFFADEEMEKYLW